MTEKPKPSLASGSGAFEQPSRFWSPMPRKGARAEGGGSVRQFLERATAALDGLGAAAAASPHPLEATSRQAFAAFLEVLDGDARKARAAVQLVLAQKSISSQLVDNLNASIHLRALLTDVFLIDEALKHGEG